MSEINGELLNIYVYKIKALETSIKNLQSKDSKNKGYIINLNDFNDLKKKVQYEKNKNLISISKHDIKDYEKKIIIKDIKFRTSQYLTNMLLNGNKYIIIDSLFWKVICEKGKESSTVVNYEISGKMTLLNLQLKENKKLKILSFDNKNRDNILEISKLKDKSENNFDLIKKALTNIKLYYDFEIKLQNDLKEKTEAGKGYLIEKDWIDKWKESINYEKIKTDYLKSSKSDKEIMDELIYIFEENKNKLIELKEIKNKELNSKGKIEECLKTNSLVLVNSDFIKSFDSNPSLSEINYKLNENVIEIILGTNNSLKFNSKDNIIPQPLAETGNTNANNDQNLSETQNNADINKKEDNQFAKDILYILLNFNLDSKELINKVENSKNNIIDSINDYCLVNSDTFSQFINFFSYEKMENIINCYKLKSILDITNELLDKITLENKVIVKSILDQKDNFLKKFQIKSFFEIKSNKYGNYTDYKNVAYPSEFQIVSKYIKEKLFEIFKDKNYISIEEISLGFITGNILFKPNKGKLFDESKYSSYIFSFSTETNGAIKYAPEILISFNSTNVRIKNFPKLVKDAELIDTCIKKISDINTKYECKAILINKQNHKLFTKKTEDTNKLSSIDDQNKYISISIKLNEEYSKLEKLAKESNNYKEYDCYLIKKNFMESLEDILCFKEIDDIINKNNQLKTEKQKLEKILKEINSVTKKKLIELDENKIKYALTTKEIFNFNLDKAYMAPNNKKEFYYDNCKLISKDTFDLINDIIHIYIEKIKSAKCIFDKGEIIILIKDGKDEVINVGNLENKNDLIIKSVIEKGVQTPSEIFSKVRISGYDYIKTNKYKNDKGAALASSSNNNNQKNNSEINKGSNTTNSKTNTTNNTTQEKKTNEKGEINNKQIKSGPTSNISGAKSGSSDSSINKDEKEKKANAVITNEIKEELKIDDKLKCLILLSINQEKDYTISYPYNNKKGYKVCLISKDLEKFKFSQIKALLNEKHTLISATITKLNKDDFPFISTQMNEIIPKLDKKKLETLNEEINKIPKTTCSNGWDPISKNIKILKFKTLKIYSEFIIAPENTFNELKRIFEIKDKIDTVNYIHNSSGDIIYKDNIVFYGKINKTLNKYDLKYIFEFESETQLNAEITEINRDVGSYIRKYTALVENNNDDKISPIFSQYKTIGNVYKYNEIDCDYSNCLDYSKYIKNEKLSAFISLYNFFNKFKSNYNKSYNTSEKYYLIKNTAFSEIKNNCNYDQLKQILAGKINLDILDRSYSSDEKEMLKIIKNIPKANLETYFPQNSRIKKISKIVIEPENNYIINQNNPNDYANIYDNFCLIDKKVAESFIEGISSYPSSDKNAFNCTLISGRIIIEYDKNLENNKYVCVIGSVDPSNFSVISEFALIYNDYRDYISHIGTIKNKLNNFLQGLQLYKGTQPITDEKFKEIGTLIQIQIDGKPISNIPQEPYNPEPEPYKPEPEPVNISTGPKPAPVNEIEYNLNSNLYFSSIRQYFQYPLLIGLDNIGATCYMNATLQCFCNIEKFVNYFKYNKHLIDYVKYDYNKMKLSSAFRLLIEKLWPDNYLQQRTSHYAPYNFKELISFMNPIFQGVAANDSKDLVNFIIMTLHEELNKAGVVGNISASFVDQRNQQAMLNNFIANFQNTNQSIISDLFYAVNCSMTQCSSCPALSYNYQTYFFIVFPLEEIRKYKLNNLNQFNNFNNMFNNNEVNIYDCFEYDRKINYMTGENAMYCNYCKKTCNSQMKTVLTTGPEILIIILNRGKGIEFNVKINFVEYLNLANFIQFSNSGVNYQLMGVITHMGESGMSGHFIAYCKSPISGTWFQYNDSNVSQVINFQSEVINYAMPYLLFYQKMH